MCLDHYENGGIIFCTKLIVQRHHPIKTCFWDCPLFRFLCEFGREDVALGWGENEQGLCMMTVCMSLDEWETLHCREAPLPMACQPRENCGMACLVMTLPWVHDSQPQPGYIRSPWPNGPAWWYFEMTTFISSWDGFQLIILRCFDTTVCLLL